VVVVAVDLHTGLDALDTVGFYGVALDAVDVGAYDAILGDEAETVTSTQRGTAHDAEVALADHNAAAEFAYFAKMVVGDEPNVMPVEEGAKTVAACLAIVESTKSGKPEVPNYEF
jgi:hypothetical protein